MASDSLIQEFTLKNRDGEDVSYVMRQHPTDHGMAVVDKLLELGIGPALSLIFDSVDVPKNIADLDTAAQVRIMADVRSKVNIGAIGTQLSEGLVKAGGLQRLAPLLLEFTTRNGKPLKDKGNYTEAYTGNLGEAIKAAREVATRNGFFEVLSTFIG